MKWRHTSKLLGILLLVGAFSRGYEAQATPQHHIGVRGVIQLIDYTNNSVTILEKRNVGRTFFWDSRTWFREKTPKPCASWISRLFSFGEKATAKSLQPGRTVLIYYRIEYSRPVTREIVVLLPTPAGSCPARR